MLHFPAAEEQDGPEGCLSIPGLTFDCRAARTRRRARPEHVRRPGHDRGHRAAGPLRPARDRPPRRRAVRRPARRRRPARPRCGRSARASGSARPDRSSRSARTRCSATRYERGIAGHRVPAHGAVADEAGLRGYAERGSAVAARPARLAPPRGRRGHHPAACPGRTRASRGRISRRDRRRGGRRTGAEPHGRPAIPTSWRSWPSFRPTAARWWPTARCCRRAALAVPPHGWVNLHFSLLPAWRGAAPVQHAILHGDDITGASTFQIEAGSRHRAGLRRGHRDDPARRHRGRPARAPGRVRRRPAGGHDGRHRGRHPRAASAVGRRRVARGQDHRRRRPGRLDGPGPARRPPGPGLHAGPGRVDDLPRRAAQARPGPSLDGAVRSATSDCPRAPGAVSILPDGVAVGTATGPVRLGWVQPAGRDRCRRGPGRGARGCSRENVLAWSDPPRRVAYDLLRAVEADGAYANLVLPN